MVLFVFDKNINKFCANQVLEKPGTKMKAFFAFGVTDKPKSWWLL